MRVAQLVYLLLVHVQHQTKDKSRIFVPIRNFLVVFLGEGGGGANTKSQVFDVEIWHYGVIHGLDRIPG